MHWVASADPSYTGPERPSGFIDLAPGRGTTYVMVDNGDTSSVVYETWRFTRLIGWRGNDELLIGSDSMSDNSRPVRLIGLIPVDVHSRAIAWPGELRFSEAQYVQSPDGSHLVALNSSQLLLYDGSGLAAQLVGLGAGYVSASWLPDGSAVLVTMSAPGGPILFMVPLSDGNAKLIARAVSYDPPKSAAWSPDGRRLALFSGGDLLLFEPATITTRRLASGLRSDDSSSVAWSRDGTKISVGDAVYEAGTGNLLPNLVGPESPNGRFRVSTTDPPGTSPCPGRASNNRLYVSDAQTGQRRMVLDCDQRGYGPLASPALPGDLLLLVRNNCLGCLEGGDGSISLLDVSAGTFTVLEEHSKCYCVPWSPDGSRFITVGSSVSVYSTNGALLRRIPIPAGTTAYWAAWSPDGKSFAYTVGPQG